MSPALILIGLAALGALVLGMVARKGRDMGLEQWTVGGRGFGWVFVFLLLAGEIYTTNKTYIKARANQEVAQALSRPENAKYAETVKAALAFFQTSADAAAKTVKEYA